MRCMGILFEFAEMKEKTRHRWRVRLDDSGSWRGRVWGRRHGSMSISIPVSLAACHHRFYRISLRGLGMQRRFFWIEPIFPGNARLAEAEHVIILDLMHAIGKVMADLGLQFQGHRNPSSRCPTHPSQLLEKLKKAGAIELPGLAAEYQLAIA